MGLTAASNSPGLSFDIENPRQHYSPGDTISGNILLNTAADVAIGNVSISFWGRAKTKIVQSHGQSSSIHRGRTLFFNTTKVLYQGQYTHKAGSFEWPFEFTVPDQADPASILSGQKWKPKDHFRSTTDTGDLDLTLPPTTYRRRDHAGRRVECFVEYVLEATLAEPAGVHRILGPKVKKSTYPIVFHPMSTPEPIQNYGLETNTRPTMITTLKLLPEHAGTTLGIRDRARSIFQRQTIPRFSFSLTVQAPTIIQLFHPDPIPFFIDVRPDPSPWNTTIEAPFPEIVLRSVKVELRTEIRCRADHFADSNSYKIPVFSHNTLIHALTLTEETPPINIGALFDFRVGNAKLGSKLEAPLCPNFTSYNIAREYYLNWELEVECAGKKETFRSVRHPPPCTVILPPATIAIDDLSKMMTAMSTGSGSDSQADRKKECEKPGFTTKNKSKTKAEEAVEDRLSESGDGDVPDFDSGPPSRNHSDQMLPKYVP